MQEKNEENSDKSANSGSKFKQYLATICVSLGAVCVGSVLAWTSPVLPQLKPQSVNTSNFTQEQLNDTNYSNVSIILATNASLSSNSDATFTLNESEEGLVGAMLAIGALLAALPAGMLADRIGRRKTLLSLVVPFTISWICAIAATNVWWLYLCRLIAGAATSAMCVCAPMYIGEIAQARIRGQLGSCFQMFLCAGILLTYTLGSFLTWTSLSIALAILPIVFGVAFFFMPETPVYLIKVADRNLADKSLRYLRGGNAKADDVAEELLGIEVAVRKTEGQKARWGDLWEKRVNRNALIAGLGVMVFQQLSGVNAVIFYTASIFSQSGSSIPPSQATIIVGIVQLVAAYFSVMVVDRRGRKFFLTFSALGMLACLLILGIYFHLLVRDVEVGGFGWVPLISLMLYVVMFAFGFGPIPWLLMSELFPGEIKGLGVMIFQQLSGINSIIFYTADIFSQAGSSIPPSQAAILLGLVQLLAGYTSVMTVDRKGRRFFLILSSLGMMVCLFMLGVYFHVKSNGVAVKGYGWVPLISLMGYIIVYMLGFGPVPWLLMSELFAGEIKGIASGFASVINWTFAFIVTFLFPVLNASLGNHITFYLFAIINGLAAMFVRQYIPETQGKSLNEIQEMFINQDT